MAGIVINDLSKYFGDVMAVKNVSLHVEEGEFLVLLGPSGCGKTTTLRCIAGVERPTGGEIYLGDRCVFSELRDVDVAPKDRNAGLVFQNYALYPHMTVEQNIAFGLKTRKFPKDIIPGRIKEVLHLVDMEGYEDRYPRQLSGGQQQRVAVARMIVARPSTLLFDEPLSNLDPKLRVSLRAHLRALHGRMGATSVYVTHDQSEAMILADRIAVMQKGEIVQIGNGDTIYHFPETISVAEFTGNPKANLIEGEVHRSENNTLLIPEADPYCIFRIHEECSTFAGLKVMIHVKPEDVDILQSSAEDEGWLKVLAVMPQGPDVLVHLRFGDREGQIIVRGSQAEYLELKQDQEVRLRFRRGNVYSLETRRIIGSFGYNISNRIESPQSRLGEDSWT